MMGMILTLQTGQTRIPGGDAPDSDIPGSDISDSDTVWAALGAAVSNGAWAKVALRKTFNPMNPYLMPSRWAFSRPIGKVV